MPPQILFLGATDHANLCHRIARAISAHVGERSARVVVAARHPFGYEEDIVLADVLPRDGAVTLGDHVDWLVTTGDGNYRMFEELRTLGKLRDVQKIAVTHAGSAFRLYPEELTRADDALGARLRFIGADSLRLAKGDPRARPYFGTCDLVPELPATPRTGPIRVTHTPSSRVTKGTAVILPALEKLAAAGTIELDLIERVPPAEVARRRLLAHVHVDQMSQVVGGFGQSAIEAMGAGAFVLADTRHVGLVMESHIPRPPIADVRDAREIEDWLAFLARDRDTLDRKRREAHEWSRAHSSPAAVAAYWLRELEAAS